MIALTSVFFGPRLTFLILLGWGVLAAGYLLAGQIARSAGLGQRLPAGGLVPQAALSPTRTTGSPPTAATPTPWRSWVGALVDGRLPPLPPLLVGLLLVTGVLAAPRAGEPAAASWC